MKKFFLTFLLVLMPLQYAQAAVCAYCCEDEAPLSSQNQSAQQETASDTDEHTDSDADGSHHCSSCHLSCTQYLVSQPALFQSFNIAVAFHQEALDYQSYIPRGLDRPNWTPFA